MYLNNNYVCGYILDKVNSIIANGRIENDLTVQEVNQLNCKVVKTAGNRSC